MSNANIILLGSSGVGKSTLINAVIGDNTLAEAKESTEGVTKEVIDYPCDELGITLIDTVGFEPNTRRQQKAVKQVIEWTKEGIKKGDEEKSIDAVWFCVDGTSKRLFEEYIKALSKAIKVWKNVPVIVVITKSYSEPEQNENSNMISNAFAKQKKPVNLKKIIPVVAQPYSINDDYIVTQTGLEELIEETERIIPEGSKAKAQAIADYKLKRKRIWAQAVVATSTGSAATVGAIPIPFSDALILAPLETAEVKGIAKAYGIEKGKDLNDIIQTIVEAGTAGMIAKAIISGLKAVPGINIAADVLNAIVAGSIVAAIGEGSVYIFEQIYLGNKDANNVAWVKKFMETKLAQSTAVNIDKIIKELSGKGKIDLKDVTGILKVVFAGK